MLVFMEGGKPEKREKSPRSKNKNQQQTKPTYDAGSGNREHAKFTSKRLESQVDVFIYWVLNSFIYITRDRIKRLISKRSY